MNGTTGETHIRFYCTSHTNYSILIECLPVKFSTKKIMKYKIALIYVRELLIRRMRKSEGLQTLLNQDSCHDRTNFPNFTYTTPSSIDDQRNATQNCSIHD